MNDNRFTGFSQETIQFLLDLKSNNEKVWFELNKQTYTQFLLHPLQTLVSDLSAFMLSIDPHLETTPSVGKTISRIYRDTRFSHDKSPYRANLWITFKRPSKEWVDAPAFFFEITPDSYRYGMGLYAASKETMDTFREMIDQHPEQFQRAISFYPNQQQFVLEGPQYKRLLNPGLPKEILDWYQRKSLALVCNRDIDERLFCSELVQDVTNGFAELADFYHYLYEIKTRTRRTPV